jgi:hypothetical protein
MNRISLLIAISLGAVLVGAAGFVFLTETGAVKQPSTALILASAQRSTTPSYYGYYRCTESMEGAGLLILSIDAKGISFIELTKAFDDPSAGKLDDSNFKVTGVTQSNGFARIKGTSESTQTTVWKTTDNSTPPEIKKTVSTSQFTLEWQQGKDAKPDLVILTLLDESGDSHAMHFERKQ